MKIFNLFSRSKHLKELNVNTQSNDFTVRIINDNDSGLASSLGIILERYEVLMNPIRDDLYNFYNNGEIDQMELLVKLSKNCKHQNELAFMCYMAAKILGACGDNQIKNFIEKDI